MAYGRSYEQIDEMTLFDVEILFEYWKGHPTADDILRAVHKIKPKDSGEEGNTGAARVLDMGEEFKRLAAEKLHQRAERNRF